MTVDEQAEAIFNVFVAHAKEGRLLWTYGDMAEAIGRPRREARLLGRALDRVRDICAERGVPDCATMVVSQDEVKAGTLKPSPQALAKHQGWHGLREQQAQCLTFEWSSVP